MNDSSRISAWQLDDNSAHAYEEYLVARLFRRWGERLITFSEPKPGERLLDAGCGTGIVARLAAPHIAPDGIVTGLDSNDGMLDEARRQDPERQVDWQAGALERLPFDDQSFELVLCQQVLQFVGDIHRALEEIHRVLTPGGRLALALLRNTEFNRSHAALADVLDRHAGREAGDMMRSPFSGPDNESFRKSLEDTGFSDVMIQYDILDVRFPSPEEYLRQEAASSPLAETLIRIDDDTRLAMLADLEKAMAPFTDDRGVTFPMQTRFVMARRN